VASPAKSPPKLALIRKIALSFPQAWENEFYGAPWFQIGKSSFALWSPRDREWIFKLPHAQEMMLFDARPETFRPMRAGRLLWSFVKVENLDTAELRDLLEAAWRMVAPKKLQATFQSSGVAARKRSTRLARIDN
jgi:hypothetical protein